MASCSGVHSEHREFTGLISIGLISDVMRNRLHAPCAYCLCIVSSLYHFTGICDWDFVSSVSGWRAL
ncbi:hypothetical protein PAXINDRAFT_169937 [Paxillus involutus ATCC 200175]|uniref:Uncharacterized protein n=1 Tax=Paxillus involutus ATCC 200175 TaxID=664439 RepID=A0A0C9U3N3_PAXIN|nr:hypothetical protein PAXINDRAFT_169937 [Paxillus involutus ATCC 200175]